MAPNPWLAASSILLLALVVFHSLLGELYLIRRLLRRDNLPKLFGGDSFTKLTLRYAWHVMSLFGLALAVALAWAALDVADPARRVVAHLVAGTDAACGVWGLVATRGRHVSWIVFLAAAGLVWSGLATF